MVWTVCKGTVRQTKQMLDWRQHHPAQSLQVTKWSTAAARPAEGLGGWRALPRAHSNGTERNLLEFPSVCCITPARTQPVSQQKAEHSWLFSDRFLLKKQSAPMGEGNKQPSLSWERPPYPPAYSLSKPRGEPQEHGCCSGSWLLLTFVSAGTVHWPFPHLCGNPPALTPSLHLRVTQR